MSQIAHFWPPTFGEWTVLVVSLLLLAPLITVLFRWVGTPKVFAPLDDENYLKLVEWERDRVLSVAKGTGVSAIGFVVTLVMALLKQEIKVDVSGLSLTGCLAGALGLVLFAAQMNVNSRVSAAEVVKSTEGANES